MLTCPHYQAGDCTSCQWLALPYPQQLERKLHHLQQLLAPLPQENLQWFAPQPSSCQGFRNKAKMVVTGTVERPILGILKQPQDPHSGVDLCDCALYPNSLTSIFPILKDFIGRAGLVPYNIAKQKGELKYILLTESQQDKSLMLRFILRSTQKLPLMERELTGLLNKLPQLKIVTANIQPQHAAILEGEQEIFLTAAQVLPERFNQIPLFIRPQGFFQTNPQVASALYHCAQDWIQDLPISQLWDLFCGVGGFGLHCAYALKQRGKQPKLTGIEIAPSAILSATKSAQLLELDQDGCSVQFQSLDAAQFTLSQNQRPDLLIVNPPRRGIGKTLAQFINQDLQPQFLLYSSCNAESMAKDLGQLTHYQMQKIRLFDMFPHTAHYEVLVLLQLRSI